MNAAPFPSLTPHELVRLLLQKRKLLIIPAILGGLLAAGYSLITPRYWEASQGLVVRQETAGAKGPTPGKFADLYEMRTLQETILEVAKSKQVVVGTLQAVDQKLNGAAGEPDAEAIDKFRERLKMLPPHGGEFGKTEVFYFYVKDPSRERAIELVGELCRQLDGALKELRTERAQSLVAELQQQVNLASEMNAEQTAKLSSLEKEVGSDLGELRMLAYFFQRSERSADRGGAAGIRPPQVPNASPRGGRTAEVAASGAGRRPKADCDAKFVADHATGAAAIEGRPDQIADQHRPIGGDALRGAPASAGGGRERETDSQRSPSRTHGRDSRRRGGTRFGGTTRNGDRRLVCTNLQSRLASLAEQRAEYANRVAAVENSRASLNQARHNLSTAKAAEAAAQGASLVTKIGEPETGPYPVGPGRTVITAAGAVAGMMLGAGLIFFSVGTPIERVSNEIVGVRPAASRVPAAPLRKPEFSKLEPAKKRPVMAEASTEHFDASEPSSEPMAASATTVGRRSPPVGGTSERSGNVCGTRRGVEALAGRREPSRNSSRNGIPS